MKFRRTLFFFLVVMSSMELYAQKDAPVAGHAATLTDLLKRDYNAIDPEQRITEIGKDRTQVIAIFRSYLGIEKQLGAEYKVADSLADKLVEAMNSWSTKKRELEIYSTGDSKDEKARIRLIGEVEAARTTYLEKKTEVDIAELRNVGELYQDNALLKFVADKFVKKYESLRDHNIDKTATSNASSAVQKGIPFLGGQLGFEVLIDGLGRFVADRLKQELTTYVIEERIKPWLQNPDANDPLAEFKVLLPKTSAYLVAFNADQVMNFPNSIRQYIEDDLNHLLENAPSLRSTPRTQVLLQAHPDIDFAFEALDLIPNLSKVKNAADYFTFLENSRNIARWRTDTNKDKFNIANAVYMTGMLSRSLVVVDNGEKRFAGTDFFTTYAHESTFFILYSGFLHQQNIKYYNISFTKSNGDTAKLKELFESKILNSAEAQVAKNLPVIMDMITKTAANAEKIFNVATEIRKANKAGVKIGADTIYTFVKSVINFSEEATTGAELLLNYVLAPDKDSVKLVPLARPYYDVARSTNEIVFDLLRKKYTTALVKAVGISSLFIRNDQLTNIADLAVALENSRSNPYTATWAEVLPWFMKVTDRIEIKDHFREQMKMLALEAARLKIYYQQYNNGPLLAEIGKLKSLFEQTSPLDISEVKALRSKLLGNDEFKKLLISYYSGIFVDVVQTRIKEELLEIRFRAADGSMQPVMDSAAAAAVANSIGAYVLRLYDNYYLQGERKEGSELLAARRALEAQVRYCLAIVPQRFNVLSNPRLISLIQFVNDMAVAQDAEDISKAIESFALPAGSYAIKRKAKRNVSLNSYPGLLFSAEITPSEKTAFGIGFTAPVGLSLSWGGKNGGSSGIYLSVIDIGAVTRLRLDNTQDTRALPEFTFKNILAPGLYYSIGFRKSPLSLNIGAQYGPELRVIKANNTYDTFDSFRLGIGLVVDIPLLNLNTKPHK